MNLTSTGISAAPPSGALIALILALIGAVAVSFLFLSNKKKPRRRGLMQKLSAHANFESFAISKILKFLYAFCLIYGVAYGLIMLFNGAWLTGLLWMLLAPVVLRVLFEQMLLLLSIREETCETNELLRRMQGLPLKNPPQPTAAQQPPTQPQNRASQVDPRYAQRPMGYPAQGAGYGYPPAPRQQPSAQPNDYGMTQRYAPIRRDTYGANGYDSTGYTARSQVVRPTPADGTGRFSPLPRKDEPDSRRP